MAKLPFSKLGIKINTDVVVISRGEYDIEIRKYLPMEEKATLVSTVLNHSIDDTGFYNPLRVKTFLTLETVYAYTNLSFTEKMKENGLKLYDTLVSSGLFAEIVSCIPEDEWKDLQNTVWHTISNVYDYKNSAMGILEAVALDFNDLNLDANTLTNTLLSPENLATLKELAPLVQ